MTYLYSLILTCSIIVKCYSESQVPLRIIQEQSKIRTPEEFVRLMINPPDSIDHTDREEGSHERGPAHYVSQYSGIAKLDGCEPRPMSVPILSATDTGIKYWPYCTRLEQCGGCCMDALLECVPNRTEAVKVQVYEYKLRLIQNDQDVKTPYEYSATTEVTLQRHLSCECRCKIKPEYCDTNIQQYDQVNCVCKCRNSNQARSCGLPKKWDEKSCRCSCPNLTNCLDGEYFDFSTCSCATATMLQTVQKEEAQVDNRCSQVRCPAGRVPRSSNGICMCVRTRSQYQPLQPGH